MGYEIFDALKGLQGRTLNLFPWGKKEVCVRGAGFTMETVEDTWRRLRKKCILVGGIIGILALVYTTLTFELPKKVYVRDVRCDYVSGEGITRSEIENPKECWIFGYQNEETRFYGFDGNMLTLEYFRGIIVSGVVGFGTGMIAIVVSDRLRNLKIGKKRNSV